MGRDGSSLTPISLQPDPTLEVVVSLLEHPGLCIARPHHRRLLALAACLLPGTGSNSALQCFDISSDVMNLNNLLLLFNCLHCQAK